MDSIRANFYFPSIGENWGNMKGVLYKEK